MEPGTINLPGRLLIHQGGDSAWNMAVDQAIAESVSDAAESAEESLSTLRFYTWAEPTLSLGYFQPSGESSPRFDHLARVRRSTGGGAILHHHELTYSLTVPTSAGRHGARTDLYRGVHAAIVTQLRCQGIDARPNHLDKRPLSANDVFLCFQRRTDEDLIVSGYKVLGSAQRRSKRSMLQHGSLLLRASEHTPELPGIKELTSITLCPESLASQIADELGSALRISFQTDQLTQKEKRRADEIVSNRFGDARWWSRR